MKISAMVSWVAIVVLSASLFDYPSHALMLPRRKTLQQPANQQPFITVNNGQLYNGNGPFFIVGGNSYQLYQRAADGGSNRAETDNVFKSGSALGLNVLRTAGHGEGDQTWHALTPSPGVYNESAFADGMDYIVDLACKNNIKLIFWLTNQWEAGGGLPTYASWTNLSTLQETYESPAVKKLYKDYVGALLNHTNTLTLRKYSEEPCILGWDIGNELLNRGDDSGDMLQNWMDEMAAYIRSLDQSHLILTGSQGFFGATATAEQQALNPPNPNVFGGGSVLHQGSYIPPASLCEGMDLKRNHAGPNIDLVVVHLWPDSWWACSNQCKLDGVRAQLRAQIQVAKELNKPLIVEEFGMARPISRRNAFYSMIYEELLNAKAAGAPIAGSCFWMTADNTYPDYDSFTVYNSTVGYELPSGIVLQQPVMEAAAREAKSGLFMNPEQYKACVGRYSNGTAEWNTGWEQTLGLIRGHVAATSTSSGANGSSTTVGASG